MTLMDIFLNSSIKYIAKLDQMRKIDFLAEINGFTPSDKGQRLQQNLCSSTRTFFNFFAFFF